MSRMFAALTMALAMVATTALPAFAEHTHVVAVGDGRCVVLAENGKEKFVELPDAATAEEAGHPLHVKVHKGQPGTRRGEEVIFVKGVSDGEACESYINADDTD